MSLPNLCHPLVLEDPQQVSDGAGGFTQLWVPLGTLWAEISTRTGRQTARVGAPVSRVSYKIVVRGAPWGTPERPKPQQRFRDGTRIFAIQAVADRDPAGRYLVCFVDEEVAT